MAQLFDLDAYLGRIGFAGATLVSSETLQGLAQCHAAAIPFENLNPYLGLPVDLDIKALQRKMVEGRRGGWCFEQNLLLGEALRAIGFEVSGLAARVLWIQGDDAITARGHMLLRVELGGKTHIVDVGFGGLTLTGALQLEAGLEQATPHEPFRLVIADGDWRLQAKLKEGWKSLYRFDLQRQYRQDYELANYYLSTHPASHFRARRGASASRSATASSQCTALAKALSAGRSRARPRSSPCCAANSCSTSRASLDSRNGWTGCPRPCPRARPRYGRARYRRRTSPP